MRWPLEKRPSWRGWTEHRELFVARRASHNQFTKEKGHDPLDDGDKWCRRLHKTPNCDWEDHRRMEIKMNRRREKMQPQVNVCVW